MKLINIYRERFTVVPNEVLFDKRLDYRSRGILTTLLCLPDGWDFSVLGLVALVTGEENKDVSNTEPQRGEGKAAIRASLLYLEKLGYLERIQTKNDKGLFTGYDYKINIPPLDVKNCGF